MMKLIRRLAFYIALLPFGCSASLGPLTQFIKFDSLTEGDTFTSLIDKQLKLLQDKKSSLEESRTQDAAVAQRLTIDLAKVKEQLKAPTDQEKEFLNQKLLLLNQALATLSEIETITNQLVSLIENHKKLLQEYKEDPEFKNKQLRLPVKSLYTFSDLEKINDRMLAFEAELKDLEEKSKKINSDLLSRKKALDNAQQEYAEKKKQQEEFSKTTGDVVQELTKNEPLTNEQKGELLDIEAKLADYKKQLAEFRVKEIEQKRNFLLDFQIKTTKAQLQILKDEYDRVKRLFQVDEKYKQESEVELEKKRQEVAQRQVELKESIDGLERAKGNLEDALASVRQQFTISAADLQNITDWNYQPTTLSQWGGLIALHKILNKLMLVGISRQELEASIELERAKLREIETLTTIIGTWYKLSHRGELDTQDQLSREVKFFETIKSDILAANTTIAEKRAAAGAQLNNNAKLNEGIKARMKELKAQKDTIFKNHPTEYNHLFARLKDAEDDVRSRSEPLARIIELYGQIAEIRELTAQKIDGILQELQSKVQQSSAPGALLKGLHYFFPDVKRFFKDVQTKGKASFAQLFNVADTLKYYTQNMYELVSFILQLLIIFLIFMLIKLFLPDVVHYLSSTSEFSRWHLVSLFMLVLVNFIYRNLIAIFAWFVLYFFIYYGFITDPFTAALFYLISIPFWLFYAWKFMSFFARTNVQSGYTLVAKANQWRFISLVSAVLFSSIFILLLRESFLQAHYKSDVPTILLAFMVILVQIALVFLPSKESIVQLIPKTPGIFKALHEAIERYYVLFLAVIIIIILLSNPYLGYGLSFFNIVSRILLILLLIPLFSTFHLFLKRYTAALFFESDGEVRERFAHSRTWYGLFVIASFLALIVIAFVIAANIWGYAISFKDIAGIFNKELYPAGIDETGRRIMITPFSFVQVLGFVIAGIVIAYLINRFILRRIFDLLLVNIGVQNALLSLTRYCIFVISIVAGLNAVGLGSSLLYIFALIGGLGVAGKEVITDFIGYFIILVQRPIKIGDYIMIDEESTGVVRHITLRSVMLRRKNSVTVIIPNSQIMTKPVVNWNYSRTYFAFDDILVTVPFGSDAVKVKSLMHQVLDSNVNILKNPQPIVRLHAFVDNGFQFLVRGYLPPDKVLDQFDIASDVRIEIVRILKSNGIEVAAPTRTVKIIGNAREFSTEKVN